MAESDVCDVDNISEEELYKLGLTFFKEHEGKTFNLTYQDKIELVALTQQANNGAMKNANLPPLGTFDIIGKERRAAWEKLGDLSKEDAREQYSSRMLELAQGFKEYIIEASKAKQEREAEEEKVAAERAEEEVRAQARNAEKVAEETQRRAIQDALNKQTFQQFKSYAEQQYPGNVDQQAILIKQLQEQHYYQYMHQLYQQQQVSGPDNNIEMSAGVGSSVETGQENSEQEDETSLTVTSHQQLEAGVAAIKLDTEPSLNGNLDEIDEPEEAQMWTRKDINEFKDTIKKEENEAIIKIGHGETVTVRVPTHVDGKSLYWEFATDSYDIGFGLFFEWVEPEDNQVRSLFSEIFSYSTSTGDRPHF